ncbi:MAG TPA: head GIN domain-containing protein [Ignavibacteria bacterium]|nr:head GIN domain-containing protein [Ignavibacteria bacterium]
MTSSEISLAQDLKGNGIVEKETRSLSSFNEIEINSVLNVFLKQSDNESVTVESDKNLIPYIKTYVKDGRLIIDVKDKFKLKSSTKLNVYVSLKNLTNLINNSVGNVKSENRLNLSSLNIMNNSVGNLELDLSCNSLNAELNSVGDVTFRGNANNANIQNNGVGNLKAGDMTAEVLLIENNSVGNSTVSASRELYIESNGVGNVLYSGNAELKKSESNGVGKIKKM